MAQTLSLNNLTAASHTIIKLDSSNVIRYLEYAGDINGDGTPDIFCDKAVIYGRNFTSNIFVNNPAATITIGNRTANFASSDGILFVGVPNIDFRSGPGSKGNPHPVGDINKDNKTEIGFGYHNYDSNAGLGIVLNNISTTKINVLDITSLQQEAILSVKGGGLDDQIKKISYQEFGYKIHSAGDINNDGIQDVIVSGYSNEKQVATIFYGVKNYPNTIISAYTLSQSSGFSINYHFPFCSILNNADLNGDGFPDIAIINTTPWLATIGQIDIFWGGKNNAFIDTYNMNSAQGIILQTPNINSTLTDDIRYFADFVSDTNNDGYGELLVGSPAANNNTGIARLVLGRANFTDVNLSNDNMPNVTKIYGEHAQGKLGYSVAYVGDVNGDKLADFAVCAPFAHSGAGACYVLYGRSNWPAEIYLQDLSTNDGYKIIGGKNTTNLGDQVVRYGDVNKDGFDDFGILVKDENAIYVIYGGNRTSTALEGAAKTATKTHAHTHTKSHSQSTSLTREQTLAAPYTNSVSESNTISNVSTSESLSLPSTLSSNSTMTVLFNNTGIANMTAPEVKKALPNNVLPEVVVTTIAQVNAYSAIARVLVLNPTSVSQGARAEVVKKILDCDNSDGQNFGFSRTEHPTGVEIDYFGEAKAAAGLLVVTTAAYIGLIGFHFFVSRYHPKTNAHFPSALVVPYMYFIEPVSKAATVMMVYGAPIAKIISTVITIANVVGVVGSVWNLYKNFDAEIKVVETKFKFSSTTSQQEMWVSPEGSKFTDKFVYYFEQYKSSMKYFMPVEIAMNMLTGAISGIDNSNGGCAGSLYSSTFVYSGYALTLAVLRPFGSKFENAFAITVATAQAIPLIIKTIQNIWQEAADNKVLNQIKDTLPTITDVAIAAKTAYDVVDMSRNLLTTVVPSKQADVSNANDHTALNIPNLVTSADPSRSTSLDRPLLSVPNVPNPLDIIVGATNDNLNHAPEIGG